ncbi:MAG: IS1634 family transposase, partial [Caldilineales bacterium]|nr:IS1634 family transposase [Caldilineales bacterium]
MTHELHITTERIDDIPLLLATMQQMGLPEIVDSHLPRHGLHQGVSWGWMLTIWLAHILSQGDHRKLPVQGWVAQAQETLRAATGLNEVRALDFSDDRLTLLLRRLSRSATWQAIEQELHGRLLRVYSLAPERVRLDTTTVSGYHTGGEESLFQFGHSKDDPTLRQVKVMMAALDPLGLPLVTQVVSGQRADDPLYLPAIEQVLQVVERPGLLFVGDCKMSALDTRAWLQQRGHHYLCPLPLTGHTASDLAGWVAAVADEAARLQEVRLPTGEGESVLWAKGYEVTRHLQAEVAGTEVTWTERVLVVRSESQRQRAQAALERRLERATAELLALTPAPGRGRRQVRSAEALQTRVAAVLRHHEVEGLLTYTCERQETRQVKYVGRGRGGPVRPQQEVVTVRYQITGVQRQEEAIAAQAQTLGWRAYVTNAPAEQLDLVQAVLAYRDEWLIERGFHRLKGAPLSLDPLFVKREDQVVGLIHLLSLAMRVLALIEFVVRRQLQQNGEQLTGLIPNNPKKGIDNPTTERLLKAFDHMTLTIVHLPDRMIRYVTPLSALQVRILELLGLSPALYTDLAKFP